MALTGTLTEGLRQSVSIAHAETVAIHLLVIHSGISCPVRKPTTSAVNELQLKSSKWYFAAV